jgi:hypothetical protein
MEQLLRSKKIYDKILLGTITVIKKRKLKYIIYKNLIGEI